MNKQQKQAYNKAYYKANSEKCKTYQKVYYQDNHEKIKAYKKVWCDANPNKDKIKAYQKAWYNANKDTVKIQHKGYRQTNAEKIKAYSKGYRKANPEKVKVWRKTNPEKIRDGVHKRRTLKLKVPYEVINDKRVFLRDGWICQICYKRVDKRLKHPDGMSASLDHIVPVSQSGSHIYSNVQLAHLTCNLSKGARTTLNGQQLRIF